MRDYDSYRCPTKVLFIVYNASGILHPWEGRVLLEVVLRLFMIKMEI